MKYHSATSDSQQKQSDINANQTVSSCLFNCGQASPIQTSDNNARDMIVTSKGSKTAERNEGHDILPNETTSLLDGDTPFTYGVADHMHRSPTWREEFKVLLKSSGPLIITFVLQYSLPIASIATVGRIGKIEMGAASLASMSASITGYVVYTGLASSLDTLCSQAYGAGRFHLVGLHFQRMLCFLSIVTLPIAALWFLATRILLAIVPAEEEETARLAGHYLRILVIGTPAYATFEAGKRYLQAQSLFNATMYILLVCAPLNALMHYLFVWRLWGFVGAPVAVVVTHNLMAILLILYIRFSDGYQCWGGFDRSAFSNWMPMIKLAVPGLIMLLAEFLAYEVLTLSASRLGSTSLAAQSVLASITTIMFQVPFSMSVAASTRIGILVGARKLSNAMFTAKVTTAYAAFVGLFNFLFMVVLKGYIPRVFTHDQDVVNLVSNILPLCAVYQVLDAWACHCNGILRATGRQKIGGIVGLFAYYIVGLPISIGTGFSAGWGIFGLWTVSNSLDLNRCELILVQGIAISLGFVFVLESILIYRISWTKVLKEADKRNCIG
ncbi:unnamed protein product [Periconia digitata]|uniref:Multidrug and toxin extrusion protein n=1 Tax=Periconia digitata TaxID=1303443 RepID=A0A9W4UAX4_9PLEO|nr:unnamed protein product [Periconia digitata]